MSEPARVAVSLVAVAKSYGRLLGLARTPVLRGVDLAVAPGATLGLAGPNGSGKSTLLRLLAGVEQPDAGTIQVLGRAPQAAARLDLVGWLSDDTSYPREMSIRGALRLAGSLHGLRGKELVARADALLERVGLAAHARQTLGRSSRGMLRRFGLAQAWIHAPQVVLLDEPTAGLDAEGFVVLSGFLDEARAAGTTVILASHVASDLAERCDELLVLLDGRVAARGAPADVLAGGGLLDLYWRHAAIRRSGAAR
jgi:ABC-type multidrug transport system ATPase subunit